ncbi:MULTISPECIES: hypothetical protein [unclassified Leucobacter]|uniref:hypothetical protein n=1 Tax=unclassified Leucobacter TaxID=2621730 RepID=UPI003016DEAE
MRQVTDAPVGVEVGANVRKALKENGRTIQWLANELQRPYITVHRWCNGSQYEWKLSDLVLVARLLEIKPYELLPRSFLPDVP